MTKMNMAMYLDQIDPETRVSILSRLNNEDIRVFNSPEYAVFPGF